MAQANNVIRPLNPNECYYKQCYILRVDCHENSQFFSVYADDEEHLEHIANKKLWQKYGSLLNDMELFLVDTLFH